MCEASRLYLKIEEAKKINPISGRRRINTLRFTNSPVESFLSLQRTMGNRAVQRLIDSGVLQTKLITSHPENQYGQAMHTFDFELQRRTAPLSIGSSVANGCPRCMEWSSPGRKESEEEPSTPGNHKLEDTPLGCAPLVPVDSSKAGATVICKNKKYKVWVNPSESPCVKDCLIKHEEKHIADFNADPNYRESVKCAGISDGETLNYANNVDAKKFECAASNVEIKCIKNKLKTEKNNTCINLLKTRMNTVLPNYKASFGCST